MISVEPKSFLCRKMNRLKIIRPISHENYFLRIVDGIEPPNPEIKAPISERMESR